MAVSLLTGYTHFSRTKTDSSQGHHIVFKAMPAVFVHLEPLQMAKRAQVYVLLNF